MIKRWILIGLLLSSVAVMAQDAEETQEPDTVEYAFEFPIPAPTKEQIDEAYECVLTVPSESGDEAADATQEPDTTDNKPSGCELANYALQVFSYKDDEDDAVEEEYKIFYQVIEANPALALRLDMIATFFDTPALVAPPAAFDQPITSVHLTYTFGGLGPSNDYDITITKADKTPRVTGTVSKEGSYSEDPEATEEALTLPETVDADVVQALAPALSDLLPIERQFSSVPCWDYYPDWTVELTFADGATLTMVTNESNVVGIGGPWQVEIDDQNYMQYSGAFAEAVANLLDAMDLPLGETAAMGCGGVTDPLYDAFSHANN